MKRIFRRKKIAVLIFFGVLGASITGVHFSHAYDIPGIDCPYDPANYYSPTSISWADTANPSFFFRDLGRQGGSVYDPSREIKSVLFGNDFGKILGVVLEKIGIDITNHTPLAPTLDEMILTTVDAKKENGTAVHELSQAEDFANSTLFHNYEENSGSYTMHRDKKAQRAMVDRAAQNFARAAEQALATRQITQDNLCELLDAASKAEGEQELRQILAQIDALSASEQAEISALMAAKIQLEAAQQRVELDEEMEHEKRVEQARFIVQDPFDKEAQEAAGIERPAPKGFVDF